MTTKTEKRKTPLGVHKETNEIVFISEFCKKKHKSLIVCPSCKGVLIGAKGSKIAHHFRHKDKLEKRGCYESTMHLFAKYVLCSMQSFYIGKSFQCLDRNFFPRNVLDRFYNIGSKKIFGRHVNISNFKQEEFFGNDGCKIKPDVLCEISFGGFTEIVNFEIVVTNPVSWQKREKIEKLDITTIEIRLNKINLQEDSEQSFISFIQEEVENTANQNVVYVSKRLLNHFFSSELKEKTDEAEAFNENFLKKIEEINNLEEIKLPHWRYKIDEEKIERPFFLDDYEKKLIFNDFIFNTKKPEISKPLKVESFEYSKDLTFNLTVSFNGVKKTIIIFIYHAVSYGAGWHESYFDEDEDEDEQEENYDSSLKICLGDFLTSNFEKSLKWENNSFVSDFLKNKFYPLLNQEIQEIQKKPLNDKLKIRRVVEFAKLRTDKNFMFDELVSNEISNNIKKSRSFVYQNPLLTFYSIQTDPFLIYDLPQDEWQSMLYSEIIFKIKSKNWKVVSIKDCLKILRACRVNVGFLYQEINSYKNKWNCTKLFNEHYHTPEKEELEKIFEWNVLKYFLRDLFREKKLFSGYCATKKGYLVHKESDAYYENIDIEPKSVDVWTNHDGIPVREVVSLEGNPF